MGDSTISPFVAGAMGGLASFELLREWAGGVGGRSIDPIILLEACLRVRGEALIDDGLATSVSRLNPRDVAPEFVVLDCGFEFVIDEARWE